MATPPPRLTYNTRFLTWIAINMPRPKNKKGELKTGKQNDKGKLGQDHPIIQFLVPG
jgi:hypothetical protein